MNIGFYSSSTPITALAPKRFHRAEKFLKDKNIDLIPGNLTERSDGYRAGTIIDRANEINQLIHNPNVNIIMSTIGGLNTNSVLPYIDYEYLRKFPKTFVGYSDTTALLLAIKAQAPQCRVLYGPALVSSLGEWSPIVEQTWNYFQKILDAKANEATLLNAPSYWSMNV